MQENRRLIQELLDLQERDRQLVAYEIHDGFVQQATAALMHLRAFREMHGRDAEEAWETFDAAVRSVKESIDEARRLMAGLRPPVLDEAGVVAAIDYLSRDVHGGGTPQIEFSHAVQFDRLSPLVETTIFRIAQESLTNARRHSRSEKVRISLVQQGDRVRLEVQDWGVGFDPERVDNSRLGLQGIRERARMLGGLATIETSPDNGTRVVAELPLEQAEERGEGRGERD